MAGWLAAPSGATIIEPATSGAAQATLSEILAKLPLRFEENVGQVKAPGVRYFARGEGYRLFLDAEGAIFTLQGGTSAVETVRVRLAGADAHPMLAGIDPLPTRINYFRGKDPLAWHAGVPSFAGVRYREVYPGTDLMFSGNDRRVEQSYFLAAGARPERIRMIYEGATSAEIASTGELILRTPGGGLTANRPVAFQTVGGDRRTIDCEYRLVAREAGATEVGFSLGAYDHDLPLVIDPMFTNHQTPLNGSGQDIGHAIGVDADGNIYVAGSTASTDFIGTILPGGVQSANAGSFDGFVAKVDPSGTTLLYSTYLGGSDVDEIEGIAVDASGNAYLTGYTFSSDFPGVTGSSIQSANAGGRDAWVAKLSPTGSAFGYSTYLGGTGADFGNGIAIDGSGNAYVTGSTSSTDFPGVSGGSVQPSNAGGDADAFVTKIDATGGAIAYSTYLGGAADDQAYQIALDGSGNLLIAGGTCSSDFPTTGGSVQPTPAGIDCDSFLYDAFVSKLNPLATTLVYSTFLGGEGAVDARLELHAGRSGRLGLHARARQSGPGGRRVGHFHGQGEGEGRRPGRIHPEPRLRSPGSP
ncbi:MAG TPA: SBBP repeat-containing protein, partial [Thermoanaerobaculia bacterium]|nr:SBBP repeat-containing protein [Thermoanaerobaculia bacterium]